VDTEETGWGILDEINLARNKEKCRAVVNTVINLRIAQQTEELLNTC
jgi:hypothetical protein